MSLCSSAESVSHFNVSPSNLATLLSRLPAAGNAGKSSGRILSISRFTNAGVIARFVSLPASASAAVAISISPATVVDAALTLRAIARNTFVTVVYLVSSASPSTSVFVALAGGVGSAAKAAVFFAAAAAARPAS